MMANMQIPQTRTNMHRISRLLRSLRTTHRLKRPKILPVKMHMLRGIITEASRTSDRIKTPPW
jgi:hypothetical protein